MPGEHLILNVRLKQSKYVSNPIIKKHRQKVS